MSDLTATSIATDLASIMAALPGAVVSGTINGHAYSFLRTGSADGIGGVADQGITPAARCKVTIAAASLIAPDVPVPMETVVTLAGTEWLVESVSEDGFGATYRFNLVATDTYE